MNDERLARQKMPRNFLQKRFCDSLLKQRTSSTTITWVEEDYFVILNHL